MTLDVRPAPAGAVDGSSTHALLIEDWLGFAGYLAEAVSGGAATLDDARAELAAASGILERHALERAADEARRHVDEPLTAELLCWATNHANECAAA